jgi:hypothetical protein
MASFGEAGSKLQCYGDAKWIYFGKGGILAVIFIPQILAVSTLFVSFLWKTDFTGEKKRLHSQQFKRLQFSFLCWHETNYV